MTFSSNVGRLCFVSAFVFCFRVFFLLGFCGLFLTVVTSDTCRSDVLSAFMFYGWGSRVFFLFLGFVYM